MTTHGWRYIKGLVCTMCGRAAVYDRDGERRCFSCPRRAVAS